MVLECSCTICIYSRKSASGSMIDGLAQIVLSFSVCQCLSPVFRLPDVLHNLGKKTARNIGGSSLSRWNPPMLGPLPTDFLRITPTGSCTSQVNVYFFTTSSCMGRKSVTLTSDTRCVLGFCLVGKGYIYNIYILSISV